MASFEARIALTNGYQGSNLPPEIKFGNEKINVPRQLWILRLDHDLIKLVIWPSSAKSHIRFEKVELQQTLRILF